MHSHDIVFVTEHNVTLGQCYLCCKTTILMQPAKGPGRGSVRNFIEQFHSKLVVEYFVFCFLFVSVVRI